ncbi:MAG: ADP-ribosylglycohydrolase family protein [Pirellulales bacterium]|nr:ADP-ribosylglycohydrolase family protein [Pirellulales bacterium]
MLIDRQRGALLGLAVGDALGAAVEFQTPGSFAPVTGYRSGGPHRLAPGEWTDDTSMALALADSMVEVGWNLDDQANRYVAWRQTGRYSVNGRCFDIGIQTRRSLDRFRSTGDARTSGSRLSHESGNGSIMRLAPVAIRFAGLFPEDVARLAEFAAESSLSTHASPQCLSACRYLGVVLAALMHGVDRNAVLAASWPILALIECEPFHPELCSVVQGSFRDKHPPEIQGAGYVVRSLEAALWAFNDAPDFETAVLRAVNLGDDADTTGAVCGQLAGAWWGESGIPATWRQGLAQYEYISGLADRLIALS